MTDPHFKWARYRDRKQKDAAEVRERWSRGAARKERSRHMSYRTAWFSIFVVVALILIAMMVAIKEIAP